MNRLTTVTAATLVLVLSANLVVAAQSLRANVRPMWSDEKVLTVLVIGSDMGLPRRGDPRRGRSDAIHIVAVDTKKLRATIVDIPRDAFIAGDRVNGHMSRGGPERLKSVLSSYTGIKLDHYVMTSFRGLQSLVDGMGGVRIQLERDIIDGPAKANLRAGNRKLNGKQALAFSRARKTLPNGDFGRTRNQGLLMRAAHKQLRERHTDLVEMTELLGVFGRNTTTDIRYGDMFRMASLGMKIKAKNVKQVSLGGGSGMVNGMSIVRLNPGSAFSDIKQGRIGR